MPPWLLNQFVKLLALVFINQVAKKSEKLDDRYKKLIEEKKAFYT